MSAFSFFFLVSPLLLLSRLLLDTSVKKCSRRDSKQTARRVYNRVLLFFCLMLLFFACCYSFSMILLWFYDCGLTLLAGGSPESPHLISYFCLWYSACLRPATDYCSRFVIWTPLFLIPERDAVVVTLSHSRLKLLGIRKRVMWSLTTYPVSMVGLCGPKHKTKPASSCLTERL